MRLNLDLSTFKAPLESGCGGINHYETVIEIPSSPDRVTNETGLQMKLYFDGSINVTVSIVAVNNVGERSTAEVEQHVTAVISE